MLKFGLYTWVFLWVTGIIILFFSEKPGVLRQRVEALKEEGRDKVVKSNFFQIRKQQEIDREIGESISFLRNLLLL